MAFSDQRERVSERAVHVSFWGYEKAVVKLMG